MPSQIQELARTVGFRGTASHRIAEPSQVQTLPVVDNAVPTQSNISTSVDCYVSGQYVQQNGKITEVTQRYTIFVSYSQQTQMQTMQQVRERILGDFQAKYGKTFNVSTVFVPGLPVPKKKEIEGVGKGGVGDLEFYYGSEMMREMSKYERARYEIGTQKRISGTNIESIKKRYGVR